MRLPILYTMSWPERIHCSEKTWPRLDFFKWALLRSDLSSLSCAYSAPRLQLLFSCLFNCQFMMLTIIESVLNSRPWFLTESLTWLWAGWEILHSCSPTTQSTPQWRSLTALAELVGQWLVCWVPQTKRLSSSSSKKGTLLCRIGFHASVIVLTKLPPTKCPLGESQGFQTPWT